MAHGSRSNRHGSTPPRDAISELTTERLSIYLRCLNYLESIPQSTVSSQELAKRFHLNSAQIRKDLANFGEFGIRGVGYNVALLKERLQKTLGIDRSRRVVIAGAGNLGMALADYRGFSTGGFDVVALMDSDPAKVGRTSKSGIPVIPPTELPRIAKAESIDIGILAVPAEQAQDVYDAMVDAGIRAVLNFAPVRINPHGNVKLKSVDLRINLESLSFWLKNCDEGDCGEETEE